MHIVCCDHPLTDYGNSMQSHSCGRHSCSKDARLLLQCSHPVFLIAAAMCFAWTSDKNVGLRPLTPANGKPKASQSVVAATNETHKNPLWFLPALDRGQPSCDTAISRSGATSPCCTQHLREFKEKYCHSVCGCCRAQIMSDLMKTDVKEDPCCLKPEQPQPQPQPQPPRPPIFDEAFFANLVNSDVMNSDLMKGYEAFRIKVGAQVMWPRLAKKILVLNYDIAYDLKQQKLRAL